MQSVHSWAAIIPLPSNDEDVDDHRSCRIAIAISSPVAAHAHASIELVSQTLSLPVLTLPGLRARFFFVELVSRYRS